MNVLNETVRPGNVFSHVPLPEAVYDNVAGESRTVTPASLPI